MKRNCMQHKGTEKEFSCAQCDLSFNTKAQLNRHALKHTKERPFKCDSCEKTFLTKAHLKRHSVAHLPEGEVDQLELVI